MSLPRHLRMTRRREFEEVRSHGTSAGGKCLAIGVLRNPGAQGIKFGVIVPKALGNAPARNRLKRQLRAIIREFLPRLEKSSAPPASCVTIARRQSTEASFHDLRREWLRLARKTGFWPADIPPPGAPAAPGGTRSDENLSGVHLSQATLPGVSPDRKP